MIGAHHRDHFFRKANPEQATEPTLRCRPAHLVRIDDDLNLSELVLDVLQRLVDVFYRPAEPVVRLDKEMSLADGKPLGKR